MTVDEELPQRVPQTIGATSSMLTVFFNSKEFTRVDLLPQDTPFTAVHFVNNATVPLVNRYAQQLEDIAHHKVHLHFGNSKCHTARHVQEQMVSHRSVRVPHPRIHPT
jgi:hypothetical protein